MRFLDAVAQADRRDARLRRRLTRYGTIAPTLRSTASQLFYGQERVLTQARELLAPVYGWFTEGSDISKKPRL
jgi:hypothetical protein